jgi:hypothetical protein
VTEGERESFDVLLRGRREIVLMLSDYPHAPELSLADRLRLIADEYPERSLEYKSLTHAADLLEDYPDGWRGCGLGREPETTG